MDTLHLFVHVVLSLLHLKTVSMTLQIYAVSSERKFTLGHKTGNQKLGGPDQFYTYKNYKD